LRRHDLPALKLINTTLGALDADAITPQDRLSARTRDQELQEDMDEDVAEIIDAMDGMTTFDDAMHVEDSGDSDSSKDSDDELCVTPDRAVSPNPPSEEEGDAAYVFERIPRTKARAAELERAADAVEEEEVMQEGTIDGTTDGATGSGRGRRRRRGGGRGSGRDGGGRGAGRKRHAEAPGAAELNEYELQRQNQVLLNHQRMQALGIVPRMLPHAYTVQQHMQMLQAHVVQQQRHVANLTNSVVAISATPPASLAQQQVHQQQVHQQPHELQQQQKQTPPPQQQQP
jgi:hypothetical protein